MEVEDNHEVGCIPGDQVMDAERELGIPVLCAATAGAYSILRAHGLPLNIQPA
ncbi:hypothetical protein [Amycolatopsis pithecellobii]|uniref:hypothetical protein n=1 Tax=Amycolatopsis pithecellobii TaxID=664692 RepID=UPI001FE53B06|nr:hypothetical protein [Amycolatopsis pithecellobii]